MQYIPIIFSLIVFYNTFLYLKSRPRSKFILYIIIILTLLTVIAERYISEKDFYQGYSTCKDMVATSRSDVATVSYRIMESVASHESYNEYIIRNTNYMCNQILQTAVNVKYKIGDIINLSGVGEEGAFIKDNNFNYDEFIFYKYHADKIYSQYKSKSWLIKGDGYAVTFNEPIKLWRDKLIEYIFDNHNTKNAELLSGMIYGRDITLSKELKSDLRDVGLTHIAVMSGYNLLVFSFIIYFLIRQISKLLILFKIYYLENIYIKSLITLSLLAILPIITSFDAPIIRAYIFIIILSIYNLMGRVENYKQTLLITSLLILYHSPHSAIYDVGLHLSILAVAGIIYTKKYITNFLKKYLKYIPEKVIEYLSVTLAAQTLVTPYIIYVFGVWHPVSILANIMVVFTLPIITIFGLTENILMMINSNLNLYVFQNLLSIIIKILSVITEFLTDYIIYVTTIL